MAIRSLLVTEKAVFASDFKCVRVSPAPLIAWDGQLELAVPNGV